MVGDILDTLREIAEGHALSESIRGRVASTGECAELAEGYSGAVFDFACRSGARIAGGDRTIVSGLGRFGRHAGTAWHMADDLSVLDASDEALIEAIEERLSKRSPNFAVSLGAERDASVGALWMELRNGALDGDLANELKKRVLRTGAISEGRKRLAHETWQARKSLQGLAPSPDRETLDRFAAAIAK
jgi:geranylgeranyl pyrophosphate synthase